MAAAVGAVVDVDGGCVSVIDGDVAAFGVGRGGLTRCCGAADGRGCMVVGPRGFGVAAYSEYSMISGNDGATVVSDVARVVGPL